MKGGFEQARTNPLSDGKGTTVRMTLRCYQDAEQLLRGLAEKEARDGHSDCYDIDQILEEIGFDDKESLDRAVDNLDLYLRENQSFWDDDEPLIHIHGGELICGPKVAEAWDPYQKNVEDANDTQSP